MCWYGNYCLQQVLFMFDQCLPFQAYEPPLQDTIKRCLNFSLRSYFFHIFVCLGERLGRMPGSVPHTLQLGNWGEYNKWLRKKNSIGKKLNQEYCDMGMDSNNCWLGNYCQSIESGGCPSTTGFEWWWFVRACLGNDYFDYLFSASGSDDGTSTFTCFEPYYQVIRRRQLDNFQTWNA